MSVAVLPCLTACLSFESAEDKELKTKMIGSWFSEYKTPTEDAVRELVTLEANGKFSMDVVTENGTGTAVRERRAGSWFITDRLYKLRIEQIDDRKLQPSNYRYFTCRIESLDQNQLSCKNDVLHFEHIQKRVATNYNLS